MKKLALALVCLVSVAFFASCTQEVQNPEPSIAIYAGGQDYLFDGKVVDVNVDYPFAFKAASNAETQKDLATFKIYIDDELKLDSVISGKEYEFTGTFSYDFRNNIIDQTVIKAVVTDVAGKMNTATINLQINQPEEALAVGDFDWYRLGTQEQTGLAEYGLKWEQNAKETHAQIKPLDGVILYKFDSSVWDEVTYESQKVAKFSDGAVTTAVYNNVSTSTNGLYDDVIGTRMPDGTLHLLHVTSCVIGAYQSAGYPIHIYGQAK